MSDSLETGGFEKPRKMQDSRPKSVSKMALSRTVTQIRTDEGQKTVSYSTLPKDAVILTIDGGTSVFLGASQANTAIAGLAISDGEDEEVRMDVVGIVKPGPDDDEIAHEELVVIQSGRKHVKEGGIEGTVEGESDIVEIYVQNHPGQFPNNPG